MVSAYKIMRNLWRLTHFLLLTQIYLFGEKITEIFKYRLLFRPDQVWILVFTLKSKQNYFTCDELFSSPVLLFTYPYCLVLEWFILLLNSPWSQGNLVLFSFLDSPSVIPFLRNVYIQIETGGARKKWALILRAFSELLNFFFIWISMNRVWLTFISWRYWTCFGWTSHWTNTLNLLLVRWNVNIFIVNCLDIWLIPLRMQLTTRHWGYGTINTTRSSCHNDHRYQKLGYILHNKIIEIIQNIVESYVQLPPGTRLDIFSRWFYQVLHLLYEVEAFKKCVSCL